MWQAETQVSQLIYRGSNTTCSKWNNTISTNFNIILKAFYDKNHLNIHTIFRTLYTTKIDKFEDYKKWITEGQRAPESDEILVFRHAPSLENERSSIKNLVLHDSRLFVPPGAQEFLFLPIFAIVSINARIQKASQKFKQDTSDLTPLVAFMKKKGHNTLKVSPVDKITIGVSQSKITWMSAILILAKCTTSSDTVVELHTCPNFNKSGKESESTVNLKDRRVRELKTIRFAAQLNVTNRIIFKHKGIDIESNHIFVVGDHQFKYSPTMTSGALPFDERKVIGNLAIYSFNRGNYRLISPGIPKMNMTDNICNLKNDKFCQGAKQARRLTRDLGQGHKTDDTARFFTCEESDNKSHVR